VLCIHRFEVLQDSVGRCSVTTGRFQGKHLLVLASHLLACQDNVYFLLVEAVAE